MSRRELPSSRLTWKLLGDSGEVAVQSERRSITCPFSSTCARRPPRTISLHYPYLRTRFFPSRYVLSSGYVIWGMQSAAKKATSRPHPMAPRSWIIMITSHLLAIITTHRTKASPILPAWDTSFTLMIESSFLDPMLLMDDHTSTPDVSSKRGDFRKRAQERDGSCVMTGAIESSRACHIVPHAKGDEVCSNVYCTYYRDLSFHTISSTCATFSTLEARESIRP